MDDRHRGRLCPGVGYSSLPSPRRFVEIHFPTVWTSKESEGLAVFSGHPASQIDSAESSIVYISEIHIATILHEMSTV
jgi:hypothetical protein